jgi:hypothetical protein
MLPHPLTVGKIAETRFQERLREVAEQRRASDAETHARSRPTTGWRAQLAAISAAGTQLRMVDASCSLKP